MGTKEVARPAKQTNMNYKEITTLDQFFEEGSKSHIFSHFAFQNIDFCQVDDTNRPFYFEDCIFLGCTLPEDYHRCISGNCLIFPQIDMPYNPFRGSLYNAASLYEGFSPEKANSYESCYDQRVYRHYKWTGEKATDIKETLARTLHDHAMSDALHDFLDAYDEKKIVGIMGGHGLLRTDDSFKQIVGISKKLTERGYLMVSGGGPGAMEATHLGAWMAGRTDAETKDAIAMLQTAPSFKDSEWITTAFRVLGKYKQDKYYSLGVPTWLYGHEPATPFATHIAKYFDNSIREDGILTIAKGGIVYTPGSAGTLQEIFQDAVQNHYLSFGYASPMAFLGTKFWTEEMPIYPLLQQLAKAGKYKNLLLSLNDDPDAVINEIEKFG